MRAKETLKNTVSQKRNNTIKCFNSCYRVFAMSRTAPLTPPPATAPKQPLDSVSQQILAAAARCIAESGVDKASADHIARAAGISRATLYRRFASREAIITALLVQQAQPVVKTCMRIMAGPRSFAERLVDCMICAAIEIPKNPYLAAILAAGVSRSNMELVMPVYEQLTHSSLRPALALARQRGELREAIEDQEILAWLVRDFLLMVSENSRDAAQVRRHMQLFVLPVIVNQPAPQTPPLAPQTLTQLGEQLARMQAHMEALQQELHSAQATLQHLQP
jgi:AcrR family transcriptional regulator